MPSEAYRMQENSAICWYLLPTEVRVHSPHLMALSPLIRFGTSTWTYEGWQGQVYKREYKKTTFARECLGEYCQYLYNGEPLFRTVGNDSTFYRPPTANQLRNYLNQIPENFEMCFKAWEELTIPTFSSHPRYGAKADQPNPQFLDASLFKDLVLAPYREANFGPHTGPFLFEFQCPRLDAYSKPSSFRRCVLKLSRMGTGGGIGSSERAAICHFSKILGNRCSPVCGVPNGR